MKKPSPVALLSIAFLAVLITALLLPKYPPFVGTESSVASAEAGPSSSAIKASKVVNARFQPPRGSSYVAKPILSRIAESPTLPSTPIMSSQFAGKASEQSALVAGSRSPTSFAQALTTHFSATPGSKIRIEGSSTVNDWQAESKLISGFLDVGSNFPIEPKQKVLRGELPVKGEAIIAVSSLQSIEKDGRPYSEQMDDKMHEMLKQAQFPKIVFEITGLFVEDESKDKPGAYVFTGNGSLAVAGVTNALMIPLTMDVLPDQRIKFSGTVPLQISQFNIARESILFVKIADDITVSFDWILRRDK